MAFILVVEDEELLSWSVQQRLSGLGHEVCCAADLAAASKCLKRSIPDVMLLDIALPDGNGLDFFQDNLDRLDGTVVIVMTAVSQVESAVRAMKLGALDFLTKPVDHDELARLIDRSLTVRRDRLEVQAARVARDREMDVEIVAESDVFGAILADARDVAASELTTVLIDGETGTGKNLVARYIHAHSPRRRRPLLEVSCASIPENLLESEFFGHERGAFTDAKSRKRGTLELADHGTVVLDEIGEIKLDLQPKLLQFLEERRFRRVGSEREIRVDVRVLALTNRNLAELVDAGGFRSDLFFRLDVFRITVPPLRERPEDIVPLARFFLRTLGGKLGRQFDGFTREAENAMLSHSWPGNVRQVRSAVERAMIVEREPRIGLRSLALRSSSAAASSPADLSATGITPLAELEDEMVRRAMAAAGDNQTRAAALLGISRDQLRYRLKKRTP